MADPVIQAGEIGHDQTYTVHTDDRWSGTRAELDARWKPLDMTQSLHRLGSSGLDEFGNLTGSSDSAPYKRHSAWHNAHQDKASYVENGKLVFAAHLTNELDPTRVPFVRDGVTYRPDLHKLYLAYRVTWDRVWSNAANGGAGGHITDPAMEARTWGPGHYFEFRADYSAMNTPGMRFSAWLMPSIPNESGAYDANMATGAENDWPEYDPLPGYYDYVHAKVIGGTEQTQTPNGTVDLGAGGFITGNDLRTQPRTFGLRWTTSEVVWYIDGREYLRDAVNVPLGQHYVLLTREANSGVKTDSPEYDPPYVPEDPGIWGSNGNVWAHLSEIANDKVSLDYFRVWEIDEESGTSTGGGGVIDPEPPVVSPRAPRLTGYVPGEGPRIRFLAGHGGGIVRYALSEEMAGTWDFSDYGGDAVAIGPTNQRVLTLFVNELNPASSPRARVVSFVPDAP